MLRTALTILLATFALLLWWLFLSRAPWRYRLLGVVGLVALVGIGRYFFELRGVSGDLVPRVRALYADDVRAYEAAERQYDPAGPDVARALVPLFVQTVPAGAVGSV